MRILKLLCATAGLLMIGSPAFAQFTINFVQNNQAVPLFTIGYTDHNGNLISIVPFVPAGSFTATVLSPPGVTPSSFTTYCVDLEHDVVHPQTVTPISVTVPLSVATPGGSQYDPTLPGTYSDLQMADWLENNQSTISSAILNGGLGAIAGDQRIKDAGLQLAIWDVIDHGTNWSVTPSGPGDRFYVSAGDSTAINDANIYLDVLHNAFLHGADGGLSDGTLYDAVHSGLFNTLGQDMLGPHGSPGPRVPGTTPEGASLLLFLPGLIPVAIGLRRRRNNKG